MRLEWVAIIFDLVTKAARLDCRRLKGQYGARELIAAIAQLGERPTEDRKVPGSIPGGGISFVLFS